jgi:hypothetical protein
MKTGELIEVVDFQGNRLVRKVVEISGETVYICTAEEFYLAEKLGQEPVCVGFNREFVKPCHGNADCTTLGAFVSSE